MSAVRGWCPSLFEPMESGDGLLVRIKPRLGRLDAAGAIRLARSAARHGNGALELTTRGNLQCRGFSPTSAELFAFDMVAAGLAAADPAVERRRALLVSPLAGIDPGCALGTLAVAAALERALAATPALDALPGKFGFLVDGGGALSLASIGADIALRAAGPGWRVEAGGWGAETTTADAPGLAIRLAMAAAAGPARRPARDAGCGRALFERAGLAARALEGGSAAAPPVAIGPLAAGAIGIGLPPGQLDCGALERLAAIARRFGDGLLRVGPWRGLVLGGLGSAGLAALHAALPGALLDPNDPRARIASCIGAPGCARGSVPAPHDAARLASALPPGAFLHVSGCAKGCAHPGAAPFTLVGENGSYALVRDGRAGDTPFLRGLTVDAAAHLLHEAASTLPRHEDHAA